ncbi:MAG: helix-turn-helix domain-containing protein [Bulleidia sp.]
MPKVTFISSSSENEEAHYFIELVRVSLTEKRHSRNMTQNELAKRMYCSTSSVSAFERGEKEVTLQWIFDECAVLGVDTVRFLIQTAYTTMKHFRL